jgi:hypothetical protein
MTIHVRVWSGTGSARVTDMTNAGKRGKACRVLRFSGWMPFGGEEFHQRCRDLCAQVLSYVQAQPADADFDPVAARVREIVQASGLPEHAVAVYDETIRGIDAPRPVLTAGVSGKWSASASEDGVSLRQLDDVNEWTEITHGQTPARAYDLAANVWPKVQAARTQVEASDILGAAGVRLHGYCGLD